MNPTLSMMLARLNVSDMLRLAGRQRVSRASPPSRRKGASKGAAGCAGVHYRLADGSWIHGRHDSA